MHSCILAKKRLFDTKLRFFFIKVYIIWLISVIAWNFTIPDAAPIKDALVSVILSFLSFG